MTAPGSPVRIHRGGGFRRWLAGALGRSEEAGDQIWRRILHGAGALVLVYFLVPVQFFVVAPNWVILLAALAAVGVLELLRLGAGVELPTIRAYESGRPASYLFYATALAVAVLLFPEPIAVAVVLGTAFVDPLAGELRASRTWSRGPPVIPFVAYAVLAIAALLLVGRWPALAAVTLGLLAAAIGVTVERWRFRWLDDDLTMTVVPAVVLYAVGVVGWGLPA